MNPRDLKNNALFLSCWYERSRPIAVICFVALILGVLVLAYLGASTNGVEKNLPLVMFYVLLGGAVAGFTSAGFVVCRAYGDAGTHQ